MGEKEKTEKVDQRPAIPGWFTIFTAVFCAGLWVNNCTSQYSKLNMITGHRLYKIVHHPISKVDHPSLGRVVFATAADGETNKQVLGSLFACRVPEQAYEWAEYLDTIQLEPSHCQRIAP